MGKLRSVIAGLWPAAAGAALSFGCILPAHAQADGDDEIIVTATRRATTVQEVPASITALSSAQIENREILQAHDLVFQAPGLVMGAYGAANLPSIRGVSHENTSGTEDTSIAIYVDGVYQARPRAIDSLSMDLERIEVLRGPQGTLYGRNATGGTINFVTRGPAKDFEGSAEALFGSFERQQYRGYISGPLSENLGYRISAIYNNRPEGYTENLLAGAPDSSIEDEKSYAVRTSLEYDENDITLTGRVYFLREEKSPGMQMLTPPGPGPFQATLLSRQFTTEPHKIYTDTNYAGVLIQGGGNIDAQWRATDWLTLRSITAYQETDQTGVLDSDLTSGFLGQQNRRDDSVVWTQEVTANATLLDDRLDVVLGAFYFHERVSADNILPYPIFGLTNPGLVFRARQEATSYSVFGDATLQITDRFEVFGGARATWDEKAITQFQSAGVVTCPTQTHSDDWSDVSPRVGARYELTGNIRFHAQWQQGFKAGGFNALSCNDAYNQEEIEATEIGMKSEFLNNRLTLNLAAFHYNYSDLQKQQIVGLATRVENAASAEVDGAEVEVLATPVERFHLNFGLAWLDAKYADFLACDGMAFVGNCTAASITGGTIVQRNVAGNPLPRSPEHTLNFGAEYTFILGEIGELTLRGEAYHSAEIHFREFNDPADIQEAYTLSNFYASFEPSDGRYRLAALVKNASDEDVLVSVATVPSPSFNRNGTYMPPRTWGVSLGVRF